MDKDQVQEQIVSLYNKNPYLIIKAATGVGKGLSVIKCIAASKSKKPWLIFVPEIHQIENFKQEFIKFGYKELLNKVEILCYASLKMKFFKDTEYNIALNEVQSLSDMRFKVLQTIKTDSIIADSATIPENIEDKLNKIHSNWTKFELDLQEAIDTGILPKPKIFLIPSTFNTSEVFSYKKFGKIRKVSAENYYKLISEDIKYFSNKFNQTKQQFLFNKMMALASQRKRFIANLKTFHAKKLIDQFKKEKRKFIVFCGSITQCNELGGKYAIHSKKSDKHNKKVLELFNNNEINEIYTVGMLISGMTLSNLDTGLIIQLDKGEENESLKAIQQTGRSLRNQNPSMYILYNPLSMDKIYMENAIRALGEQFIINN